MAKKLDPIHPGEILKDTLDAAGISLNELSRALRVPVGRISEIVNGKRAITADTALRMGRYFNTSAQMWLNLQSRYDLEVAERESGERIAKEVLALARPA